MHSPDFEKIKKWYDMGIYSKAMVRNMMLKGKITEDEYKEIVGENLST